MRMATMSERLAQLGGRSENHVDIDMREAQSTLDSFQSTPDFTADSADVDVDSADRNQTFQ